VGIPTAKYLSQSSLEIQNWQQNPNLKEIFVNQIEQEIGYPNFVKPPKLGSSIGITKARNRSELLDAIDLCLYYDDQILVEQSVENLADLTCCVLENSGKIEINMSQKIEKSETQNLDKIETQKEIQFPTLLTSLVQESTYSKELFSFEDKYLENGGSQTGQNKQKLIIPAQIDENITKQIQEYSQILFAKIGCSGIARFDFLLDKENKKLYFSEVNPLPGNLYRHLWASSGVEFDQVIEILIKTAMEKSKNPKITNFSSNLLKIANSSKMNGKFGKGGKFTE
jgi:D-alanine-D-alanine ligase